MKGRGRVGGRKRGDRKGGRKQASSRCNCRHILTVGTKYSEQLRKLEAGASARPSRLPQEALQVCTPLKADVWEEMLANHPDRELVGVLTRGIREGFRIGTLESLTSSKRNMSSASEHWEVVESYIQKEVQAGRMVAIGTTREAEQMGVHCSPFGVIPKKGKAGRWRLIVDLSSPEGRSVNDGIDKELATVAYMSVDDAMAEVLRRGKGTRLAKMDIQQAYRNVPVHPLDRHLLGMEWQGKVYVDGTLPFGLRSAPLLSTAAGDALQWVMEQRGVSWVGHYIDDFVTVGDPGSTMCGHHLEIMKSVCQQAGMPTAPDKEEGPTTVLHFLGMELDTNQLVIRLPLEKLEQLKVALAEWRGRKACRKISLIGILSHACKAVRAGRSFLRRFIDLSTEVKQLNRFLNAAARSDIISLGQIGMGWP